MIFQSGMCLVIPLKFEKIFLTFKWYWTAWEREVASIPVVQVIHGLFFLIDTNNKF